MTVLVVHYSGIFELEPELYQGMNGSSSPARIAVTLVSNAIQATWKGWLGFFREVRF